MTLKPTIDKKPVLNIFYTVEPAYKIKEVFVNLKYFYILDISELMKSMHLDLSKSYNIYFMNKTILDTIEEQYKRRCVKGIIFINRGLSIEAVHNIEEQLKMRNIHVKNILIDNNQCPKLKKFYPYFEDVLFYERFRKIKINELNEFTE